jgi:ribA/ribD-fused uncharacterized protein
MSKAKARAKAAEEKKEVVTFHSHRDGKYAAFSQWNQTAPFTMRLPQDNGHKKAGSQIRFYNCEQYMTYRKAILFKDYGIATQILATRNPKLNVVFGKKIANYREDIWNNAIFEIVVDGNYLKFNQNGRFKALLMSTGTSPIGEANPNDAILGIGIGENHPNITNPTIWSETGQNILGKALMEVRLRFGQSHDPTLTSPIHELTKLSRDFNVNPEDL